MNPLQCLLMTLVICSPYVVTAQEHNNFKVGKVAQEDFSFSRNNIIDSNSGAIIIADVGNTTFEGNKQGWFSYVFKRFTKIKIIDHKAFDLATVHISLYQKDEKAENLVDLKGGTYNLENGKIVESSLNSKDVFTVKKDKNNLEKKFTLPSVKDGSIIEYSYTIRSDFQFNLPSWAFQNINYPCLWSEYNITLPAILVYVTTRQGVHPFCINKAEDGHGFYRVENPSGNAMVSETNALSVSVNTTKYQWAMKDIPAFKTENFLTTPKNYIDRIGFQLSKTSSDGLNFHDVLNSWEQVTKDLLNVEDFGGALKDNSWMSDIVKPLIVGNNNSLATAKAIYYYLNNNFTCNDDDEIWIKTSLKDVFKKRNGNVGEINLMLVALLRQTGIQAEPVLLSTRDNGFNSSTYPILARLNYVLCKAEIEDKTYYLDASRPLFGFGKLSPDCYNGYARVISLSSPSSLYFTTDSLKEQKVTMVAITNEDKGKISGRYQAILGDFESHELRVQLIKENEAEYFKNLKSSFGSDIHISN